MSQGARTWWDPETPVRDGDTGDYMESTLGGNGLNLGKKI